MNEPGVLASGYWIPDGIAVIGEGEFLFADRGGALYHYAGGGVTEVRGLPRPGRVAFTAGYWTSAYIPVSRTAGSCTSPTTTIHTTSRVARFELRDDRAEG